jgi:hypothetical protein
MHSLILCFAKTGFHFLADKLFFSSNPPAVMVQRKLSAASGFLDEAVSSCQLPAVPGFFKYDMLPREATSYSRCFVDMVHWESTSCSRCSVREAGAAVPDFLV